MFLRTPEAKTHVYIHRWGPKATCHDTLEPIRNIGRVPTWAREAPGGRSSRMKYWVLSTSTKKKCLRVPPRYTLFAPWNVAFYVVIVICGPLPSIILYRIFQSTLFKNLILKGGATSLELVSYISVLYFANLCTSTIWPGISDFNLPGELRSKTSASARRTV